ncbi:MAG: hypothetical protein HYS21_10975 [Deltaproteobacteria bacterium]|nr:hypothetical protein [Deltaproteobacteria bacterium]
MGIREDIEILDAKIARLKVEYEQYFMRVLKREPLQLREEIDRLVMQYSNQTLTNTSQKFKYNSIIAKYNSYKQYWTRVLRSIDEGTYVRKAEGGTENASAKEIRQTQPKIAEMPARANNGSSDELQEVYKKYIEARKECHEPTEGISFETLAKTINETKKKVESLYKTTDVELKVFIKDGKAKLAITPKKTTKSA